MEKEFVILVNEHNRELGVMEKQEVHQKGLLHRAFSIFVFNSKQELLIQQRSFEKYHSAGLWTNTCCSHPRVNETTPDAALRRLKEEMGFECTLTEKFSFIYKAAFDNGLIEHELDLIYTGFFDMEPVINPREVSAYKWISLKALLENIKRHPENYTVWFRIILDEYLTHLNPEEIK